MQFLYFRKNKNFFVFLSLLLISFFLMFFNIKVSIVKLRPILFFIVYPFQVTSSWIGNFAVNTVTSINRINELEKELEITKQRLIKYQEALLMFKQVIMENEELKKALDIKSKIPHSSIYARVVFRDPTFLNQTIVINKGLRNGIKQNMAVVSYNDEGEIYLVGKVFEVSLFSSKVKVLNSADFYLGVSFLNSSYIGILKGSGGLYQNCLVNYIPVEAKIDVGEIVITSGESKIFPPHIRVGKVVAVSSSLGEKFFKKVYVKPYLNYSKIKEVFVIDWHNENPEVQEETKNFQ